MAASSFVVKKGAIFYSSLACLMLLKCFCCIGPELLYMWSVVCKNLE